ncbi:MAG: peroxiredoxin [Gammaproteobacteria bacterium]|jgi:peroxiredoxin
MLEKNQPAPDFSTVNQDNKPVKLADFRNDKNVILYFYPKDDTPGCTIEANQFTELADEFSKQDTVVLGVSKDSCDSHRAFIDKYGLNVQLLADTDGELVKNYDVWQEKEKNGEKKMGIVRSTFLINKDGNLEEALYGVNPEGHAQQMLEKVQQL